MKYLPFLLIGFFFLGTGCSSEPPMAPQPKQTKVVETLRGWRSVDTGVDRWEKSATSTHLVLYRFTPTSSFQWEWKNNETHPQTITNWLVNDSTAVLIANGVYFREDYSPAGLLMINHMRVGQRRFDDDKSGMIDLSPSPRVINTKRDPIDPKLLDQVAQSYPFLITAGQPALTRDTGLIARRTFIGTDQVANIYLGVELASTSLYQLMQELAQLPISWQEVLNLDGGPSTGIATRLTQDNTTINSYTDIPNVLVIRRK